MVSKYGVFNDNNKVKLSAEQLKERSPNFMKTINFDLNICEIHLVTINRNVIEHIDYSGFTSTQTRIWVHIFLLAIFYQRDRNAKSGYSSKYSKWYNQV